VDAALVPTPEGLAEAFDGWHERSGFRVARNCGIGGHSNARPFTNPIGFLGDVGIDNGMANNSDKSMDDSVDITTKDARTDARTGATAKDVEGRLEAAFGDLTGDRGHQIKGKAKQVQASAMKAAEALKEGGQSVARSIADAAAEITGDQD
jgi:hypothetical protein